METFSTIVLNKVLVTLFNRSFGKHDGFEIAERFLCCASAYFDCANALLNWKLKLRTLEIKKLQQKKTTTVAVVV